MDLTPLYELRERLRSAVIAGAALAGDDFRLRRAVDAFAPFEKAAPVFARLGQLCRGLLEPDCPDRAGALLDAVTLADAVLCTQAAASVPGEVEPLPAVNAGAALSNAPYSVLNPLLEALTTSGGGKFSFVVETHDRRPELFDDYRVREALVQALGAAYAELADRAQAWLTDMGEPILPLLYSGFDPKGGRDMVRRVRTVEAIAGAGANEFYLSNIPEAEKDVRATLVFALRHDGANAEKLVELFRTEKGPAKRMAGFALARMDCPAANKFWLSSEKNRAQAVKYAALSTASVMSRVTAEAWDKWLAPFEADPNTPLTEELSREMSELFLLLPGKSGPEICAVWRRLAAIGPVMDKKPNPALKKYRLASDPKNTAPFSHDAAEYLRQALIFHPAPDLLDLAEELQNTVSADYAAAGLTAVLLRCSSEEAYERSKYLLRLPPKLMGRPKAEIVSKAFSRLWWSREQGHFLVTGASDPAAGREVTVRRPIPALDRRWYQALAALGEDSQLARLVPLDDPALCARTGEYLYERARKGVGLDASRLRDLRRLGWKKCEGLGVQYARQVQKASGRVGLWQLQMFLQALPGDRDARQAEAREVCRLAEKGTIVLLGTGGVLGAVEALKASVEKLTGDDFMTTDQFM